jgi:hypothetical protein
MTDTKRAGMLAAVAVAAAIGHAGPIQRVRKSRTLDLSPIGLGRLARAEEKRRRRREKKLTREAVR